MNPAAYVKIFPSSAGQSLEASLLAPGLGRGTLFASPLGVDVDGAPVLEPNNEVGVDAELDLTSLDFVSVIPFSLAIASTNACCGVLEGSLSSLKLLMNFSMSACIALEN